MSGARRLTCAEPDEGHAFSANSAIMKAHATGMRAAIDDTMNVHSGQAIINAPSTNLPPHQRAMPIGTTVESAALKRKEMISGRMGVRSDIYIISATLKRWQHADVHKAVLPRGAIRRRVRVPEHPGRHGRHPVRLPRPSGHSGR